MVEDFCADELAVAALVVLAAAVFPVVAFALVVVDFLTALAFVGAASKTLATAGVGL